LNRNYSIIATVSIIALFMVSGVFAAHTSAYTNVNSDSQKKISLSIQQGIITNAGPQKWSMNGGKLIMAAVTSPNLVAVSSWSDVDYSLNASVNGLNSTGTFKLHLHGATSAGKNVNLRIDAVVVDSIPAACFPSYSMGTCLAGDNSEIPAFLVAVGYANTGSDDSQKQSISLMIEDAALNPFGDRIVISSLDGSIMIVATYDHAKTIWEGVQLAGIVTGSIGVGASAVSGNFVENITTTENYVTGTARDNGQIALVGMTPKNLNSNGPFNGSSTIPTKGSFDCSPFGLPKTCLETGFASSGSFTLMNQKGWSMSGKYDVEWPAPSVVFAGTITAKMNTGSNSNSGNRQSS
jgi:hypothetical protein